MKYIPTQEVVFCVPLYALTDLKNDTVDFLGSGILLRFSGKPLLDTAAHVIDNGRKFTLIIAGPREPLHLSKPGFVTPVRNGMMRETDPLDLYVIGLEEREAAKLGERCRFLEWEKEALLDIPDEPWPHKIMGYPDQDNSADSQRLYAHALRIDVYEDRNLIEQPLSKQLHSADYKKHPRWYIGLRYDPRLLEKGEKPKVKTLHGFSGGAILRTDGRSIRGFAGIVTESNPSSRTGERLIYGLRATAIGDLLEKWMEDGCF